MADKTIPALKILRGKVGINTATPSQQLHVNGEAYIFTGSTSVRTLSGIFKADTIENSAGASNLKLQTESGGNKHIEITPNGTGNVGINTNAPGAKIDVNGSAIFRGAAGWAGNDSQACAIYLNTAGRGVMGNFSNYARNLVKANSNYVEVGQNSTLVYGVKFIVGSNAPNGFMFQSNIGGTMTTHMSIRGNNGSVGIGTANPGSLLTISGNSDDGDNACALRIIDEDDTGGSKLPAIMFYGGSTIQGRIRGGDGTFAIAVGSTPTTAFSINTTSRKIAFGGYGSGTHTGTAAYKLAVDSSGNVIETAVGAGQVDGSGTANKLALWTDADTIGDSIITQSGTAYAQVNGGVRITGNHTDTGSQLNIWCDNSGHARAAAYDYFFYSGSNNSRSNLALFLSNNGSVGINTASPSAKLHVHSGNVVVTSGKQLISTNTYSQAPIGMLTIQGPTTGSTALTASQFGIVIGPQHTRSATANTYYPGIVFNHLLNHGGTAAYNNAPQAYIGTRLHDTPGSERAFLVFATKSGTGTSASDVPIERMCIDPVYGSIGIGSTDPAAQLQIGRSQTTSAFTDSFIKLRPSNTTNSTGLTSITLGTSTVDNYGYSISGWRAGTDGSPYLRIQRHHNSATGTDVMVMKNNGDAVFYGGNWYCNTNNSTNVSNGGLYINRGGGLYAYALATARSGTALNGVDFWDYHGVGLVFGPDSSTKVLTVKSNIGIGTTDPGYKLEVKASVTGNWLSRIYNTATSGNSGGLLVRMDEPGSTGRALGVYANGGYKFTVEPDGEVQILSGAAYTTHLNYQNSGTHFISMANGGATYFRGSSNSITTMTVKGDGKVGILDSSPQTALAVNGEASFGDGSRLSLIGLSIASSAASPNIKIRTKIPFALSGADFTVNIKGFIYGLTETANLTVCWHYYNSTFYNATCSSAGSWAPTIQLSAEDWDSSGTKKVCICLSTPGYWVKAYVESMFSHTYNDQYTDGWTWVDGTASGTGNDLASLSYRSDFGNNFRMLSNGCVGIGGGVLTNAQLTVNGGLAVGDATYQSNMNNGAADFSVDCNGTPQISWISNYLQIGGTNQNWNMRMSTSLLQTYSSDLTITAGGTGTTYKLYLGTNGQTQTITCNNGSVGINTTSPGYKLDVYGGDARVGTNLRLGNGSAAGNSTNPAITSSGVTTAGVYFENSGVGFGAGSGSKYLFLSSAGNASLGGNGFFKQLGDRPYGTDNLNDYYRSNDEASFCQFYRYDATHGHWANSSGTLTTNAPSTLTQTTSQIYSYGSLLTLRSLNSFRGQFYFAHSASEFYWRSGWGTSSDQNWTRIVGDRNIQSVINNVGNITITSGTLTVNNTAIFGAAATKLKTYSDSTYSGIYNGSSLGSDEAIYFGSDNIYFYNGGSQSLQIDSNLRLQLKATDYQLRYTSGSHIWYNRLTSGGTFAIHKNGVGDYLSVTSAGNVGIGTNNPATNLYVGSGSQATSNMPGISIGNGTTTYSFFSASDQTKQFIAGVDHTITYTKAGTLSNHDHAIITSNTPRIYTKADGNVGVSSVSPAATLDVKKGSSNTNNKLMKVADDVLSVYKVTGLSNHTVTLTCGSYFQAEVVITANQTNGGTYNNLYIRGIWSNNHYSHHWDEIENIGSLSGSSFSIAVSANDVSNSGKLVITHTYSSGSFSQMVVRVTDLYGVHSYSIT